MNSKYEQLIEAMSADDLRKYANVVRERLDIKKTPEYQFERYEWLHEFELTLALGVAAELRAENARLREAMEVASWFLDDICTLRKAGKLRDPNGAGDILNLARGAQKALLKRFASQRDEE